MALVITDVSVLTFWVYVCKYLNSVVATDLLGPIGLISRLLQLVRVGVRRRKPASTYLDQRQERIKPIKP